MVGRVAAIDNRRYNEHKDANEVFFGYLELEDDAAIAARLMDTVAEWASRRGLDTISGPRGLLGFDGSVLIEGFEHDAVVAVPWNKPHYGPAIEAAGGEKDEDYLSGSIRVADFIPDAIIGIADKVMAKGNLSLKGFASRRELTKWVPQIKEAYLASVATLDSFYPPTDAEIDDLVGSIMAIADPRGIKLVMSGDQIVGFLFCYPDMAPALRDTGGRLWPFGWSRLLRERSTTADYCINGLGMLPEYRGRGGNAVLYAAIARTARDEIDMYRAEVVQVAEHNPASLRDMEKLGTVWRKRHRRYRWAL